MEGEDTLRDGTGPTVRSAFFEANMAFDAVSAAYRIQEEIAMLNKERFLRKETTITISDLFFIALFYLN